MLMDADTLTYQHRVRLAAKAARLGGFGTFAPGASSTPFQHTRYFGNPDRRPYRPGSAGPHSWHIRS